MARLSASVMAHPSRAHLVKPLIKQLGLTGDNVAWDRIGERWDTGRRAWQLHDPNAEWHIVIQDDVITVRDLIPGLARALDHLPGPGNVCPFVGTRRPVQRVVQPLVARANYRRSSWIELPSLFWGVAIAMPVEHIDDMIAFGDAITEYPNYDKRVGQYFVQVQQWPTFCTWPNLVDHRSDVPSLCGHGPGRTAHRFAGTAASALDFPWDRGVTSFRELGLRRRRPRRQS